MLLRVTKVSGGNSATDPRPPSDPPLHACLATAVVTQSGNAPLSGSSGDSPLGESQIIAGVEHAVIPASPPIPIPPINNTGEVLTIGRKNCTVTVEDKCVSRTHATIALLSNRPPPPSADACSSLLNGRIMMEYGTPSTPEEVHACETSTSGVICVIRDRGSKFGTYVSVDETLLTEYSPCNDYGGRGGNDGGGGDETGDETDDEGGGVSKQNIFVALTDNQTRAVSLLSDDSETTLTQSTLKFQKLDENQSRPLLQLSHSKAGSPYVIILFGPQGSAIRLSLVPMLLTFSRYKAPDLDPILASLHYIGARCASQWDPKNSTHLVAPDKTAAAKGIMAWACRKPVVTKAYIEALLERKVAREDLPKESDYCPPGSWDANYNVTSEPSSALKGYLIAVMVDDDNAPLALSAGAAIILIHEEAPDSEAEFAKWWNERKTKALADGLVVAVVNSTSKTCKNFSGWLKDDGSVRFTNAKNIAKAITGNNGDGDVLVDVDKAVIEKVAQPPPPVGLDDLPDVDHPPASTKVAATKSSKNVVVNAETANESEINFNSNNNNEDEPPASTRRKRPQEEVVSENVDQQAGDKDPPERQKRHRKNQVEEAPAEEEVEEPITSDKSKNQQKVVDESSDDEPGIPTDRISLPTTSDGWFVAAPKKRKAFRKQRDEDVDEEVPDSSALTEKISGLIVREYIPPNKSGRNDATTTATRAKIKKKDFKRCKRFYFVFMCVMHLSKSYFLFFVCLYDPVKKNNVLLGYTTFNGGDAHQNSSNLPKIRLVDVLPKESARQLALLQQQENLEREQELADHLFNDNVGAGGRNMMSYLSQSTAKKGRGRR